MKFKEKIVLVTGASRGIGLHLSARLIELGAKVIGIENNNIIPLVSVDAYKCNLASEDEIDKLFIYLKEEYGHLDYVINCAAIDYANDITEKTKKEFMDVLEINLVAPFLICKKAINLMDNGVIVNISSTDATDTFRTLSMDYASSKAGLENLTKNLALRYPNIKICALAPNWVDTESISEMSPIYLESELRRINQKRLLTKEEVTDKIIEIITNNKIRSGEIIRMDGNDE